MNSSTLEAHPSPEHPVSQTPGTRTSSTRPVVSRASLADRLALRLGMALVICLAVIRCGQAEDRRARQFAAERRALTGMPRR
jgi:hypothetical protein